MVLRQAGRAILNMEVTPGDVTEPWVQRDITPDAVLADKVLYIVPALIAV